MINLDDFVRLDKGINLIYGAAATGKTTISLIKVMDYSKEGKVVFIDTENGFSLERLKKIAEHNYKILLDNLFVFNIKSFKDQQLKIKGLNKTFKNNLKLVIVDTLCYYYRRLVKSKPELANSMLRSQLRILRELSKSAAVLITNQVYTDIDTNKIRTVASHLIKDYINYSIRLEKNPRKIILEIPEKKERKIEIVDKGILIK